MLIRRKRKICVPFFMLFERKQTNASRHRFSQHFIGFNTHPESISTYNISMIFRFRNV